MSNYSHRYYVYRTQPSYVFFYACLCLLCAPAVAQEQRHIVFRDDFSNNDHAWPTPSNRDDKAEIQDGVYRISKTGINSRFYWVDKAPLNSEENYSIRARIRQTGGPTDWGYGVLWGAKDAQNINAAYITSVVLGVCTGRRNWRGEEAVLQRGAQAHRWSRDGSGQIDTVLHTATNTT